MLADAVPVSITGSKGQWQLLYDGKPFAIRGAAGNRYLGALSRAGGNSFRTWGAEELPQALVAAQSNGLTVAAGIWLRNGRELDYRDRANVALQTDEVRLVVAQYKENPAILLWGVGNEMENHNNTPELWQGVGAAAAAAKATDPSRPVMTSVADVTQEKIDLILRYAPGIDILGVNTYSGLPSLAHRLKLFGWTKPYIVTEFGPRGHWECPKTAWGAPLEQTSTEKAALYSAGYEASIKSEGGWCLGSYAFYWGSKQEATPTWFGMFLPSGEPLEAVDVMEKEWTGQWPEHRAPRISAISLSGRYDAFKPGDTVEASVDTMDADLRFRWEVRPEVAERLPDGKGEITPAPTLVGLGAEETSTIEFLAPNEAGHYRLYAYVLSSANRAATANIPFRVK